MRGKSLPSRDRDLVVRVPHVLSDPYSAYHLPYPVHIYSRAYAGARHTDIMRCIKECIND